MGTELKDALAAFIASAQEAARDGDAEDREAFADAARLARRVLRKRQAEAPEFEALRYFFADSVPHDDRAASEKVLASFTRLCRAVRDSRKRTVPLERLRLGKMASGNRYLALSRRVAQEDFPAYAEAIVRVLGATVEDRADSPVERAWTVTLGGDPYWLSYDDHTGVSLESRDERASEALDVYYSHLRGWRDP